MLKRLSLIAALTAALFISVSLNADEGMYPLSEIHKLDLASKGLKIDVSEIYNPDGVSLVDAICQVGGGTGEFVSADGLILTNHHIAFDAVTSASTPERDYLHDGFTARTRAEEIEARGYICRITESYRDVSDNVLGVVTPAMTPAQRSDAIHEKMQAMAKEEENGRENITCEVSEMFPGKTYILFTYRLIKDVRLVYVPPRSIGEYGGETDNWVWPRHTGDFSFMRAYVAPDGSTASYSEKNVPYTPKRYIKVAPEGVSDGDFVMILGYPGRTYRNKPADYIGLYERTILPMLSRRYDFMINTLETASRNDRGLQLQFASMIKSLSNATKNYKGKLQGLRRLKLVEKRQAEEAELRAFINNDAELKSRFGATFDELKKVYSDYERFAAQEINAAMLARSDYMSTLFTVIDYISGDKRTEDNKAKVHAFVESRYQEIHQETQLRMLASLLHEAALLPADLQLSAVRSLTGDVHAKDDAESTFSKAKQAFGNSLLRNAEGVNIIADWTKQQLESSTDPFVRFALQLKELNDEIVQRRKTRDGELNRLEAEFVDAKMAWKKTDFIPDANLTLRLTYGNVRGYAPADATSYASQTTLRGVIEKNTGEEPFDLPQAMLDLYNNKSYDKSFVDSILQDVPVAMLYDTDTTGGNSGSPVLNARGELVGVNFDRAYEATVNDYQWSEEYSRSIGVDIRYVLFVAKYLGKADFLLKELGV